MKTYLTTIFILISILCFSQEDSLLYNYETYETIEKKKINGTDHFISFEYGHSYPKILNNEYINNEIVQFVFDTISIPKNNYDYVQKMVDNEIEEIKKYDDFDGILDREIYSNVKIIYNQNNLATIEFQKYIYWGGAHGVHGKEFVCYDIYKGNKLNLHSLFGKLLSFIEEIAEEEFYKHWELDKTKKLSEQGFWFDNDQFKLTNHFYFDSLGIHFYYNEYEISSYATGPTDLVIPWSLIKKMYLKNGYLKNLKEFSLEKKLEEVQKNGDQRSPRELFLEITAIQIAQQFFPTIEKKIFHNFSDVGIKPSNKPYYVDIYEKNDLGSFSGIVKVPYWIGIPDDYDEKCEIRCYKNGLLHGLDISDDGSLFHIDTYKNGILNGPQKEYWYGTLFYKGKYLGGKKHGVWRQWYIQTIKKDYEKIYDHGVLLNSICWDEKGKEIKCEEK